MKVKITETAMRHLSKGFAFYERSLALYRDWELADIADAQV